MEKLKTIYEDIAAKAEQEFSDAADYIWKSPRFIEHETKLEKTKFKKYFPDDDQMSKLRWHLESNKLNNVFPYLMSLGNLFSILSLFETYLLLIIQALEREMSTSMNTVPGNGINRLLNYFNRIGIDLDKISTYQQIIAAIKIRNCLSHASGILSWSKDKDELKRIKNSGVYLSKEHRNRRKSQGLKFHELSIFDSGFGERLQIENNYSHILAGYLRSFILDLCQLAASMGT